RLLSMRLRELEAEGMVEREVLDGSPVRVRYTLTEKGRALEPALQQLGAWARYWLRAGQRRFRRGLGSRARRFHRTIPTRRSLSVPTRAYAPRPRQAELPRAGRSLQ